jgi:zinc protease
VLTKKLLYPLLLVTVSSAAAQKQAPPAPGTPKGFTLPAKREMTLPNGMGVTIVPYGVVPKVDVQLVVRVGNVDERPNQVWLADLMGDLMEEGTTTRSAEAIARDAAGMGGAIQVSIDANQTTVGGSALGEFAPGMVRLIADVARHPSFPDSELARLKANRIRDLAIEKSQPQSLALEKFRAVLYRDHPYGRLFPTAEMVQGYTVAQIRSFYDAHMSASASHLYVVGRFDATAVERAAREAFGDWKAGNATTPSVPKPTSTREVYLIDRPGAVQSTIYLGLPVADPSSPDYIPMLVTNALLGGSFASRITSNIREQKGYTYSPLSTVSSRYHDAYWVEVADVTTNVTGASLKEILGEIDRLRREPPSAEELRGVQNYLAGTFVLRNASRAGIINQLAFVRLQGLGDSYLTNFVKNVYAVTPADVQRIAQKYLPPDRMTIVVAGDRKAVLDELKPYGRLVQ